jgi:hypothetical protein
MNNYKRLSFFLFSLSLIFPLYATQLKLIQTITPVKPISVTKLIIYKNGIYLMSNATRTVVFMDKNGKILQEIGGKGEGPGEFKYLTDFTISDDRIIVCGGRRINLYSMNGKLIESVNIRSPIVSVFSSNHQWFYVMNRKSLRKEKRIFDPFFVIYNSEHKDIYKIPDETVQRAYHPRSGNSVPFPWFPSPFCNRPIFLQGNEKKAAIFMTRQKDFCLLIDSQIQKERITALLESEEVTPRDKENFFEKIVPKPNAKTKKSVVFPEHKEFFVGAISWGNGWALIKENSLIIIDAKGHYQKTIVLPDVLKRIIRESGYPDGILFRAEELYCINNDEEILIFSTR